MGERGADTADLAKLIFGAEVADQPSFGGTIKFVEHRFPEIGNDLFLHRLRQGGSIGEDRFDRRTFVFGEHFGWQFEDHLEMRRHHEQPRNATVL